MTKRFTFYVQMMLIVLAGFITVKAQTRTTNETLVKQRATPVIKTEGSAHSVLQTDAIFSYK